MNTPYEVYMNKPEPCKLVCVAKEEPTKLSVADSKLIAERIQEEYYVHL